MPASHSKIVIRPPPTKLNYRNNLDFQALDWVAHDIWNNDSDDDSDADSDDGDSDDESNGKKKKYGVKEFTIKIYGITEAGNSICVHVKNFNPYFFIRIPDNWSNRELSRLVYKLKDGVRFYNKEYLLKAEIVKRKELYGFTNNRLFKYAKFTFKNKSAFYDYRNVFYNSETSEKKCVKIRGVEHYFQLYESNVEPHLRFMHIRDLAPSGWLRLPGRKYSIVYPSKKSTRCQYEVSVDWENVDPIHSKSGIGKLIIASFDIECTSGDGTFPQAVRKDDKVIQIGTTVHRYGEQKCFLHYIVTLGKCDPITPEEVGADHVIVESCATEMEVLMKWAKFIDRLDPDVITGYNTWGFDFVYLYKRAQTGNGGETFDYSEVFLKRLNRNRDRPAMFVEKKLSSSALGDNFLKYIAIEGVVNIDMFKLIQKDHKLNSYKLDAVAEHFMGLRKVDLSPAQLFKNFRAGTPSKIKEIAVYCLKDCELCNRLIMKLEVVANNMGMSNVCIVPFSYLFLRGQGVKIFSLVSKKCRDEDVLVKLMTKEDADKRGYEGAIVFTPEPGIYFEPIGVVDYASLYPSSMIAENISHDSLVWVKEYDADGNMVEFKGDLDYDGLEEFDYNDIEYDLYRDEENEDKLDKLRSKNPIVNYYNHGSDVAANEDADTDADLGDDFEVNNVDVVEIGDDAVTKGRPERKGKVRIGHKVCRYAEPKDGSKNILPRILMDLLSARRNTRKKIKFHNVTLKDGQVLTGLYTEIKDEETKEKTGMARVIDELGNIVGPEEFPTGDVIGKEDTYNSFEKAVLDGLQLAYKITANSLYGQVGATTSPICLKELAASTTATGRKMVMIAKNTIEEKFVGAKVIYGDSVTADTPTLVRDPETGMVDYMTMEELGNGEWEDYHGGKEACQVKGGYEVWTEQGFTRINRVIRHKTEKEIVRVLTHTGVVDVTEDHSLLDKGGNKVRPLEVEVEAELMHSDLYKREVDNDLDNNFDSAYALGVTTHMSGSRIPESILNGARDMKKFFIDGYYANMVKESGSRFGFIGDYRFNKSDKLVMSGLFYLCNSIGYNCLIDNSEQTPEIYQITYIKGYQYNSSTSSRIKRITRLGKTSDYVYDLETENHHFSAGIGRMIVHNTDSVFVNFMPYIEANHTPEGDEFTDAEKLNLTLKYGIAGGKAVTSIIRKPHDLEYEKIFYPFIIFSKKRYVANKFEFDMSKAKLNSMGIVLKRRDNANIVKEIYGGVIDIILNQRDIEPAKVYFRNAVRDLLAGNVEITKLVITKSIRGNYANPTTIAHKVLADRMGERDPGNKPQSNDRIPYCYIDKSNLRCFKCGGKNINEKECKCRACMKIFCPLHVRAHKVVCKIVCRFCKQGSKEVMGGNGKVKNILERCKVCYGWYCEDDMIKHRIRTDKYGEKHNDKCKKPLSYKLIQGDIVEHPKYIEKKGLKIDYRYYYEHQIDKPVMQIFGLDMVKPETLVEDIMREDTNKRTGQRDISQWFTMVKK